MLYKILVYFSIMALGFVLKSTKFVSEREGQLFSRIIVYVTLPAVIINAITSVKLHPEFFSLTFFGMTASFLLIASGWFIFSKSKIPVGTKGSLILTFSGLNLGIFAYPFAELVWGNTGLTYMAMFDIGNALIIYTLGYSIAMRYSADGFSIKAMFVKMITFPPLMAFIAAITINLSSVKLPVYFTQLINTVGGANTFLSLMTMGLYLNFDRLVKEIRHMLRGISVKYAVGFIIGISFYFISGYINPSDTVMAQVALVSSVMPTPILALIYSIEKKLDPEIAGGMITLTVIASSVILFVVGTM